MVRLALIGAGNHCRANHAPALAKYAADHPDRLKLVGVCDLVEEKAGAFAREFGFPAVYTDFREMIEKEKPDGCVCVMAIPHIANLAMDLMRQKMPVTVEKPMGQSLSEVRELVAVARQTGTPNMVSVNRRFQPLLRRAVDWAREQGSIRYIRASMHRHRRTEDFFMSGTAIHSIDALREIGGEVTDYGLRTHAGDPPWFFATFTFASGALGSLDVMPTDGNVEERYEIFGEGYRVDAAVESSPEPRLRCWKENRVVVDERPPAGEPHCVRIGPYAETHEFVTALEEHRCPWPSVEEVYPSVEIAYRLDPSKKE